MSRSLLTQGSRHLPPWLIFNVRQKKMNTSRLYYWNTDTEVMLGDVVEIRKWFRSEIGVVAYIPGLSPKHPQIYEDDIGPDWMIRRPGGGFWSMGYAPEEPPGKYRKNIRFIERGKSGLVTPDEDLGEP
jgi:hypothetical protein